jgi:hypothetical protein
MPAKIAPSEVMIARFAGLAALAAWSVALFQALPRLMAGPICSARSDMFSFAGHCPACFVAAGFTLVFLASLARPAHAILAERIAAR